MKPIVVIGGIMLAAGATYLLLQRQAPSFPGVQTAPASPVPSEKSTNTSVAKVKADTGNDYEKSVGALPEMLIGKYGKAYCAGDEPNTDRVAKARSDGGFYINYTIGLQGLGMETMNGTTWFTIDDVVEGSKVFDGVGRCTYFLLTARNGLRLYMQTVPGVDNAFVSLR